MTVVALNSGIQSREAQPPAQLPARPGKGGARAGAGRKKKSTAEQQAARRDAVIAALPAALLKHVVQIDLEAALAGETARIDRWLPYVLGSPKAALDVAVAADVRIVFETVDDRDRPACPD